MATSDGRTPGMTPDERALLAEVAIAVGALADFIAEGSAADATRLRDSVMDRLAPLTMKLFPNGPPTPGEKHGD